MSKFNKKSTVAMLCMVLILTALSCDKRNAPISATVSDWECILEQWNTTITLRIDAATNLVTVSKTPKEHGPDDGYHQFRDGDQYLLQNDTLYFKDLDGTVSASFAITRLSEDKMELEYLGILPDDLFHIRNYLFNRITLK